MQQELKWYHVLLFIGSFFLFTIFFAISFQMVELIFKASFFELVITEAVTISMLALICSLLVMSNVWRFLVGELKWRSMIRKNTYLYVLLGFFLFYLVQYFLIMTLNLESGAEQTVYLGLEQIQSIKEKLLFIAMTAVLVPIYEEVIFRGVVYRILAVRYHFLIGLVASSVFFGLMHPGLFITTTIMGVILVLVYRQTGSILPCIFLHILWNLYVSLQLFI